MKGWNISSFKKKGEGAEGLAAILAPTLFKVLAELEQLVNVFLAQCFEYNDGVSLPIRLVNARRGKGRHKIDDIVCRE